MGKDDLTEEERQSARENGFVISGKTGAGKTTLLNAIFGKEVGRAERSLKSVTQHSTVYYYKLENGKCITLVDTPGLSDANKIENKEIDNIHLDGITKVISKQNIHIKGILFLVNFQNERFDADEQEALLKYNEVFPLKKFWQNLIVIFTHHFADPDGDNEEEMKSNRDKSNGEIFCKIMDKVKNVSDVIDYKGLKIRYFNSYSPEKNEKQKIKNVKVRDELEIVLDNLIQSEPLFSRVEIVHSKNYKMKDEKTGQLYLAEVQIIGYFDLNNKPLRENVKVLTKIPISENEEKSLPPEEVEVNVCKGAKDESGDLIHKTQKGDENTSYYYKTYMKEGAGIGSIAGILAGGAAVGVGIAALPAVGIGAAVVAASTFIGWLCDRD